MIKHTCELKTEYCRCSLTADEPSEKCAIHGSGEWPPRCGTCGRFVKWELVRIAEVVRRLDR